MPVNKVISNSIKKNDLTQENINSKIKLFGAVFYVCLVLLLIILGTLFLTDNQTNSDEIAKMFVIGLMVVVFTIPLVIVLFISLLANLVYLPMYLKKYKSNNKVKTYSVLTIVLCILILVSVITALIAGFISYLKT